MVEEKDGLFRQVVGAFVNAFPINRVVALATPVFVLVAGWLATQIARYAPGLPGFSKDQLVAFFVAGATAALIPAWQWLRGYSKHEENQAMIEMASVQDTPPDEVVEGLHFSGGPSATFSTPSGSPVIVSPDRDSEDHDTVPER